MKPRVLIGSSAGMVLLLAGIGGAWVMMNFETVAAKALEMGAKLAVKRGVQVTPETAKLLLELTGGVAGAGAAATAETAKSAGKQTAGRARQAGTTARRQSSKAAPRTKAASASRRPTKTARSAS